MRWQVTQAGLPTGEDIDDCLPGEPGDDCFSPDIAMLMAKQRGGDGVSYIGISETTSIAPTMLAIAASTKAS